MKRLFAFKVTYFRPSGKFYTEEECWLFPCVDAGSKQTVHPVDGGEPCLSSPSAYMHDAVDEIERLRDTPGCKLPGLSGNRWNGPILIECQDGFPVLVMPKEGS